MARLVATLRTLGVLLTLWGSLAVAGIATGAVPLDGSLPGAAETSGTNPAGTNGTESSQADSSSPSDADEDTASTPTSAGEGDSGSVGRVNDDAVGTDEGDALEEPEAAGPSDTSTEDGVAGEATTSGEPVALEEGPETSEAAETGHEGAPARDAEARVAAARNSWRPSVRWRLCASSAAEPSLAVAPRFGDERPEVIVGCGDGWHVVGLGTEGPVRVAVFTAPAPESGQLSLHGPAVTGDVDGDGTADLLLPLARQSADNQASRGGALYWIPRSPYGGVRDPVALAPIAAVSVAVGDFDDGGGADVVAMNRTNALARLPSEVWAFAGGSAPTRLTALSVAEDGHALASADLDRDGHTDVAALSRDRLDIRFGGGDGSFERSHRVDAPSVRELAVGDLDGDGGADLAILGDQLRWIRAGAVEAMRPRVVEGAPAGLRGLQLVDVNGDDKVDAVGWDHPRLVILRHHDELAFTPEAAFELRGPVGPRRHVVTDLDGDGVQDDLVMLVMTTDARSPLELLFVHDITSQGAAIATEDSPRDVADAPLILRTALATE